MNSIFSCSCKRYATYFLVTVTKHVLFYMFKFKFLCDQTLPNIFNNIKLNNGANKKEKTDGR